MNWPGSEPVPPKVRIHFPALAEVVVACKPEWASFVREDGGMVVELQKALYGLKESARLWYLQISGVLQQLGLRQSQADKCLFTSESLSVCLYVDDMLLIGEDRPKRDLINALKQTYELTEKHGDVLKYLGMRVRVTKSGVYLSNPDMIDQIVRDFEVENDTPAPTPATDAIFAEHTGDPTKGDVYLSWVMRLVFLSRIRPDIKFASGYLARQREPTESDLHHVKRIARYLKGTRDLELSLTPGDQGLTIQASADASYVATWDAKSISGNAVWLGGTSLVHASSRTQKLTAKSSCEAELYALNDVVDEVLWLRYLMEDLGHKQEQPTVVQQDNQATIRLAVSGPGSHGKTKHVNVRAWSVKDHLDAKELVLAYTPTDRIVADGFTKPLTGTPFVTWRDRFLTPQRRP